MRKHLKCVVDGFLRGGGLLLLTLLVLCFTPYPWRAYAWLAKDDHVLRTDPDVLVLLGGGGIPSESGLMRSYVLAQAARQYPNALVAVAMPDTNDVSCIRMKDELIMRGIAPERIVWEDQGRNTREQAVLLHRMLYVDGMEPTMLVVTSPNHLKRALLTFRKAGFHDVAGMAAFEDSLTGSLLYKQKELGGQPSIPLPEVGQMYAFRYTFWNNQQYLSRTLSEWAGLAYYRIMGWL